MATSQSQADHSNQLFFWYCNLAAQSPELLSDIRSQVGHTPAAPSLTTKQLPTEFRARFKAIGETENNTNTHPLHNQNDTTTNKHICTQYGALAHAQHLCPRHFPPSCSRSCPDCRAVHKGMSLIYHTTFISRINRALSKNIVFLTYFEGSIGVLQEHKAFNSSI